MLSKCAIYLCLSGSITPVTLLILCFGLLSAMWEAVHRWAGIPMFYERYAITSEYSLHSPE
jgi:hypothetical protein